MQRFKLIGLSLLAVLLFSAVATATASAALPEILPVPTEATPLTFTTTGEGNAVLLTTAGKEIVCKKSKSEGKFTSADKGETTIKFNECTTEKGAVKCKNAEAEEILLSKYVIHLVTLKLKPGLTVLGLGLLVLIPSTLLAFTCGVLKILVLGAVIGEFLGINTLEKIKTTETRKLAFLEEKSGLQLYRTCEELKAVCEGKEFLLKSTFTTLEHEELASQLTTQVVSLGKEAEVHF